MYKEVAKLILYRDLGENSILRKLAVFSRIMKRITAARQS